MYNWLKFPENKPEDDKLLWAYTTTKTKKIVKFYEDRFINFGGLPEYKFFDTNILYWCYVVEPENPNLTDNDIKELNERLEAQERQKKERKIVLWSEFLHEMQVEYIDLDKVDPKSELISQYSTWRVFRDMRENIMDAYNE